MRKILDSEGREVVDVEFDQNPDGSRFILHAFYLDGSRVADSELDEIARRECLCEPCWEGAR